MSASATKIVLTSLVRENLEIFLKDRPERFPKVTETQKVAWTENMVKQIEDRLSDNDDFYDNMPRGVKVNEDAED